MIKAKVVIYDDKIGIDKPYFQSEAVHLEKETTSASASRLEDLYHLGITIPVSRGWRKHWYDCLNLGECEDEE